MAVVYQFNKKTISFVVLLFIFSLVLAYVAGLVTGVSMDRPIDEKTKRAVVEKGNFGPEPETETTAEKADTSGLVSQTKNSPVSPEFKDSSPASEKPVLSAPE